MSGDSHNCSLKFELKISLQIVGLMDKRCAKCIDKKGYYTER